MKSNLQIQINSLVHGVLAFLLAGSMLLSGLQAADYYVDPSTGSMSNNGSISSPWSTLTAVFAANKTFAGGDKIYLLRGNHGAPVIKGTHSAANPVTILAAPGHSPVLQKLTLSGAHYWIIKDLFVNREIPTLPGATQASPPLISVAGSTNNKLSNICAFSTQHPHGWAANEAGWAGAVNGIETNSAGDFNTFEKVYVLNVNNGFVSAGNDNVFSKIVVENYVEDGVRPNAGRQTLEYSYILNSVMDDHTKPFAQRAHRDMLQSIGSSKPDIKIIGNYFNPWTDPTMPMCDFDETSSTKYMEPYAPVIAGWDGPFEGWEIKNNTIFTNASTAIWLNNASNCVVANNSMHKISDIHPSHKPNIRISQKTATSPKSTATNYVYNNIMCGAVELKNLDGSNAVAGADKNISVTWAAASTFFLSRGIPSFDLRLKSTSASAINQANATYAPSLDADGSPRIGVPDVGAYEQGLILAVDSTKPSVPGKPNVIAVPGLGADLSWTASTDNRIVAGYDIYRNGSRVGRNRVGTRYIDLYTGTANLSYTIVAFDLSNNYSSQSAAGTPTDTTPGTFALLVNSGSGGGFYLPGTVVNISADTPAQNKIFDKWTGDVAGVADVNATTTTFTMGSQGAAITATYRNISSYILTVNGGTGDGSYFAGTTVSISADAPELGKLFDRWTGDISGISNINQSNTSFVVSSQNSMITSTYKIDPAFQFSLTVNSGNGDGTYMTNSSVPILADAPPVGQVFLKWNVDPVSFRGYVKNLNSSNTIITIPMGNITLTAIYGYQFNIIQGRVYNKAYANETLILQPGDVIPIQGLLPEPPPTGVDKVFDQWVGDIAGVADVTSQTTQFTMPSSAVTITATYKDIPSILYTLSLNAGFVKRTSVDEPFSSGGNYLGSTRLTLQAATPPNGQYFDKWIGDISGIFNVNSNISEMFTQAKNSTITATYKNIPGAIKSLTVVNGTGSGNYVVGSSQNVEANVAAEGKTFDRWTGGTLILANATSASTVATIPNSDVTITATYKDLTYGLVVDQGSGDGQYKFGQSVVITAEAAPVGKRFDEWTGDVSGIEAVDLNKSPTTLVMPSANIQVSATYAYVDESDHDLDGMDDDWEASYGFDSTNPADALLDLDLDGLTNKNEFVYGTMPNDVDSDKDGIKDGLEVRLGRLPNDPEQPVIVSAKMQGAPVVGGKVVFVATAGHPGGIEIVSYTWSFVSSPVGAPALATSTTNKNEMDILVSGEYVVSVLAKDANGVDSELAYIKFNAFASTNLPPVADAGPDAQVVVGEICKLHGMNSSDGEDQKPATYEWTILKKPDGSASVISSSTSETANITPDVSGLYVFHLQVTDTQGLKSSNMPLPAFFEAGNPGDALVVLRAVSKTASNPPMIQLASEEVVGQNGQTVALNAGSSTDPDGGALTFLWEFVAMPQGSTALLSDPSAANPSFVPDMPGVYTAMVKVRDSAGHSDVRSVKIQVEGSAKNRPVVNAGQDQRLMAGAVDLTVSLSGAVSDLDNDVVLTTWTQIEGPSVIIANQGSASTSFTIANDQPRKAGLYRFALEAVDQVGLHDVDVVNIVIESADEHVPVVKSLAFPQLKNPSSTNKVILNGESRIVVSMDAMGDTGEKLTVFWTQVKGPSVFFKLESESATDLIENEVLVISPNTAGEYLFKVYVDDGKPRSEEMEVSFTADAAAEVATSSPVVDLVREGSPSSSTTAATVSGGSTTVQTEIGSGFSGGGGCLLK